MPSVAKGMATAYIGIGSNLGNREQNCERAIELLRLAGVSITSRSSLCETAPWGLKDQAEYINLAIGTETCLPPGELLALLKKTEREMGREPAMPWGPRIIDLDILLYDDLTFSDDSLIIPHPFMHVRDFVLRPLAEIAPEAVHPVLGLTVRELTGKSESLPGKRILIYGVGNPLYRDDGLGNRIIEILSEEYLLPGPVRMVEAGSLTDLLDFIDDYDAVIVIDTIIMGRKPGDMVSFVLEDMSLPYRSLSHATGFLEGLKGMRERPDVHFICVEPEDISLGTGLSETISHRIPVMIDRVLRKMVELSSR